MSKRVIVVGAGILGSAIAWYLAREGAKVTVLDAGDAGGLATRTSFAWINASWGNPEPYFRLRHRAMEEWRRLDREVPGLAPNWCGGLIWDLEPEALEAFARQHAGWGYGIRRVGRREIAVLEPNLKSPPEHACHVAEEGMLEPLAASRAILAGAEAQGVETFAHTRVKWLIEEHGRIAGVATAEGPIHGDETVIAAGAGAVQLLDSIGIALKLTTPPGLLAHTKPVPELLRGLVLTPGLHVRQAADGRLIAGTDFAGADPVGQSDALARELMSGIKNLISGAETLDLDHHTTGYRPTPADGFPAVGRPRRRDGLYLAVTHSGVTLAPAIGLFAAREIVAGARDPLLAPYHPDRPELG